MSDDDDNSWSRPNSPPPPNFLNSAERDFRKQVTDELVERVIGQKIAYYPIDVENTNFHPLYGEAIDKTFRDPVVIKALIDWENLGQLETSFEDDVAFDVEKQVLVHFHKRRLTEDQELYVKTGDFFAYGGTNYEIAKTMEPKRVFGQINHKLEITALGIRSRQSLFQED